MHVFSAWTLESFASRVVANNAACVAGDARPTGPARFSPERTAHQLAGLVRGPIWRHTENHAFRTARLQKKKMGSLGRKMECGL